VRPRRRAGARAALARVATLALALGLALGLASCDAAKQSSAAGDAARARTSNGATGARDASPMPAAAAATDPHEQAAASALFAGGCFWCMEAPFDAVPGVIATISGYTDGETIDPTYEEVSSGTTGHAESIRILYDSTKVSYAELLDVFWRNIDPLSPGGQFCDRGNQYRSAIFYEGEAQRAAAEESKRAIEASGRLHGTIVTEIVPASTFYEAEEYHQDFYKKDPKRYYSYREGCGRDRRLAQLWGAAAAH